MGPDLEERLVVAEGLIELVPAPAPAPEPELAPELELELELELVVVGGFSLRKRSGWLVIASIEA